MKKLGIYLSILVCFIILCSFVFHSYHHRLFHYFEGEWQETHWDYQTADNYLLKPLGFVDTTSHKLLKPHHKGDKWIFKKNGELHIIQDNQLQVANWTLKGRGNILEITNGNDITEHFDIKRSTLDEIELQYISAIQIKEKAKLVFKQIQKG